MADLPSTPHFLSDYFGQATGLHHLASLQVIVAAALAHRSDYKLSPLVRNMFLKVPFPAQKRRKFPLNPHPPTHPPTHPPQKRVQHRSIIYRHHSPYTLVLTTVIKRRLQFLRDTLRGRDRHDRNKWWHPLEQVLKCTGECNWERLTPATHVILGACPPSQTLSMHPKP